MLFTPVLELAPDPTERVGLTFLLLFYLPYMVFIDSIGEIFVDGYLNSSLKFVPFIEESVLGRSLSLDSNEKVFDLDYKKIC